MLFPGLRPWAKSRHPIRGVGFCSQKTINYRAPKGQAVGKNDKKYRAPTERQKWFSTNSISGSRWTFHRRLPCGKTHLSLLWSSICFLIILPQLAPLGLRNGLYICRSFGAGNLSFESLMSLVSFIFLFAASGNVLDHRNGWDFPCLQ